MITRSILLARAEVEGKHGNDKGPFGVHGQVVASANYSLSAPYLNQKVKQITLAYA
jgi:hypothetical protein